MQCSYEPQQTIYKNKTPNLVKTWEPIDEEHYLFYVVGQQPGFHK